MVGTKSASYFSHQLSSPLISTLFTTIFMVNIDLLLMNLINAYLFIILFMFSTYGRLATTSIISSYFSTANNRAGFNVLQTSFTHLLSTFAFFIPSVLLGYQPINLASIQLILILCLLSAAPLPFYIMQLKRRLVVIRAAGENI